MKKSNGITLFLFYKNIVFPTQAEYSYFLLMLGWKILLFLKTYTLQLDWPVDSYASLGGPVYQ